MDTHQSSHLEPGLEPDRASGLVPGLEPGLPAGERTPREGHAAGLELREVVKGHRPGDQYVRIARHRDFKRIGPSFLIPRPDAARSKTLLAVLRRTVFGTPIPTTLEAHERLTKFKALAVFSSDALSSVAYATEEIMKVLVLGGLGFLSLTLPISTLIVVLLAIVVISYRQTIRAYPSGGGSYIVASDNLGETAGLTAAASLLIDYVLTVSVSIAAGVAALTSLLPSLLPYSLALSIAAVILIMLANLRGIRESGAIFAIPTYAFVAAMYALLVWGFVQLTRGGLEYTPPTSALAPLGAPLGLFFLMTAFAQGCTAMTGTEAISNGVPAFKAPEAPNARATLVAMGLLLGTMFLGMSYLATQIGIVPAQDETVLSQLGRTVFGVGPAWAILQLATALILVLAANTSFADFPRLASILAHDHFLPRGFQFRGDRLAFTAGIVALAGLAILLLVAFNGSLDHLIPLYAVGVFTSFTLSQSGMVVHWYRQRSPGWQRAAVVNGVGAVATGVVTLVIASTKFLHGAWIVVLLIPLLIEMMRAIRRHYRLLDAACRAETPLAPEEVTVRAVVPMADLGLQARQALAYARSITSDDRHVVAVHVADDVSEAERVRQAWDDWDCGVELVIIGSPFRSLAEPLLSYVDALREMYPTDTITVILPELVPSRWWENLLHNQTALRLKAALLFHPGIVVTSVPYHLARRASR
ncbi:MAG: APC family permease [Chloroflexi bacterium]|nr:APC family permease [Chloroflexota bacterium]